MLVIELIKITVRLLFHKKNNKNLAILNKLDIYIWIIICRLFNLKQHQTKLKKKDIILASWKCAALQNLFYMASNSLFNNNNNNKMISLNYNYYIYLNYRELRLF